MNASDFSISSSCMLLSKLFTLFWISSSSAFNWTSFSFALRLASFVFFSTSAVSFRYFSSSSFSGAPSVICAGHGWWTDPHTGHGSPVFRTFARIPACSSRNALSIQASCVFRSVHSSCMTRYAFCASSTLFFCLWYLLY